MDREWLARRLDDGASYEQLARECGRSPWAIALWAHRLGRASVHAEGHRALGPLARETLAALVAEGASVREMAAILGRSPSTLRSWLRRHDLRTVPAERRLRTAAALAAGDDEPLLVCRLHGEVRHVRRDGGYRCSICRIEQVTSRRRRVKALLVEEAGGRCVLCGYDRCPAALHFHHLDPATKAFEVSGCGIPRALTAARAEARKCVLLCANCHAEVESGVAELSPKIIGASPAAETPVVPG